MGYFLAFNVHLAKQYSKNNRYTMTKTKKSLSKSNQDHLSIMVCGESCPECTLSQEICDEMEAHTAAIVRVRKYGTRYGRGHIQFDLDGVFNAILPNGQL